MVTWYAIGAGNAIAIGWLAAIVHASGYAPFGLTSLGVGIALGAALGALAVSQRLAGTRRLVVGTLILALVTVLAEHAWLYRDFRRQWHEERKSSPEVAMFRPETPWSPQQYFERELTPSRAALWLFDGALIGAAAIGTVLYIIARTQANSALRPTPNSPEP